MKWLSLVERWKNEFKYGDLVSSPKSKQVKRQIRNIVLAVGISYMIQQPLDVCAQPFANPVPNSFGIPYLFHPVFTDMDLDGDLDLWTVRWNWPDHGPLRYFENIGTDKEPDFATAQVGPFGLDSITIFRSAFADLDGDEDLDLIGNRFLYYSNDGTVAAPDFSAPIQSPFGLLHDDFYLTNDFIDLDDDGDFDLLVGQSYYGTFYYHENVGTATNPQFASRWANPFGLPQGIYNLKFLSIADLDGDGDHDILTTEAEYFRYFENIGTATTPQFADPVIQPFGLPQPGIYTMGVIADLDADGDGDILVHHNDTTYFHENLLRSNVVGPPQPDFQIYPNPVSDYLNIESADSLASVEIYDMAGRLILSEEENVSRIDLQSFRLGVYIIRLVDSAGKEERMLIRKD